MRGKWGEMYVILAAVDNQVVYMSVGRGGGWGGGGGGRLRELVQESARR